MRCAPAQASGKAWCCRCRCFWLAPHEAALPSGGNPLCPDELRHSPFAPACLVTVHNRPSLVRAMLWLQDSRNRVSEVLRLLDAVIKQRCLAVHTRACCAADAQERASATDTAAAAAAPTPEAPSSSTDTCDCSCSPASAVDPPPLSLRSAEEKGVPAPASSTEIRLPGCNSTSSASARSVQNRPVP